jgi:hypothetical protein
MAIIFARLVKKDFAKTMTFVGIADKNFNIWKQKL